MMIRTWTAGLALALALASPAPAFDIDAMTEDEKAAFGEAVRDYLMANPELLREWITVLQDNEAQAEATRDNDLVAEFSEQLFNDGHSWVGGNVDGDVTLVEFLDYRCSFCRRAHPEVTELVAEDGGIRKIIKELPILGPESVEASRFAIAVKEIEGPDAYKVISDTLMEHRGQFSRDAFERIADGEGLDGAAIVAAMDSDAVTDVIEKNRALAVEMSIQGTPTFVLGDQMLRGYVPLDGMREIVTAVRSE